MWHPKAPCKRLYGSAHTALQLQPGAVAGAPARSYLALADKLRTWSRHSDDVQNVYTNFDLTPEVQAELENDE